MYWTSWLSWPFVIDWPSSILLGDMGQVICAAPILQGLCSPSLQQHHISGTCGASYTSGPSKNRPRSFNTMPSLLFIDETSTNRKQIRSHVMRGKNKGRVISRGKKNKPDCSVTNSPTSSLSASSDEAQGLDFELVRDVGNYFTFCEFPVPLDKFLSERVFACKQVRKAFGRILSVNSVFNGITELLYPLDFCLPYDPTKSIWVEYMGTDEACKNFTSP